MCVYVCVCTCVSTKKHVSVTSYMEKSWVRSAQEKASFQISAYVCVHEHVHICVKALHLSWQHDDAFSYQLFPMRIRIT